MSAQRLVINNVAVDLVSIREEMDWLVLADSKACTGRREMKGFVASKGLEAPMDYR